MKKLLLLLLIVPALGFGQVLTDVLYLSGYNVNPANTDKGSSNRQNLKYSTPRGLISNLDTLDDRVTVYTVPQGKLWVIKHFTSAEDTPENEIIDGVVYNQSTFNNYDYYYLIIDSPELGFFDKSTNDDPNRFNGIQLSTNFLKGGTKFWFDTVRSGDGEAYLAVVHEYSLESSSLSYNEPEAIENPNTPVLFPNPTSSLLALNSDKEYDIEVYDMLGNKLMALTGNSINMEHLSTATYIVKATDKLNKEELTYKVVKN